MAEPLVFVDSSRVREGRLDDLKAAMKELVAFVEANEPETLAYSVYLDEEERRVTVVQVHRDSASMAFHMKIAGPVFARFADLLDLQTVDVYGSPSDDVLDALRQKSELLGGAPIAVHPLHAGITRFG